jgi:hypothetical protein
MKTVTVPGGDLYRVALTYLGDATQATRIATLNGLGDFFLSGSTTLLIPPVDPSQTGGAPTQ